MDFTSVALFVVKEKLQGNVYALEIIIVMHVQEASPFEALMIVDVAQIISVNIVFNVIAFYVNDLNSN